MSYVALYVEDKNLQKAQLEFMRIIWQDNVPKGFKLKFENNNKNLIYGHISQLDQDQCDWLSLLPNEINYFILDNVHNLDDALNFLIQKLSKLDFYYCK
jgi:hypothetical protein